ncbi:MAG: acetyltransferase [Clostridiales bacterium]|nr:acetyltransferase [Clostridiales bacterium]
MPSTAPLWPSITPTGSPCAPSSTGDVPLVEAWLRAPHIQPWYEHPESWGTELAERRSEFRFISHWIAEFEGQAIGFCQYYDCYDSKEYEDWGIDIPARNEIYSIDYLIGDPACLRQGCGTAMIRELLQKLRALGAKRIIVAPDEQNAASNRALEKCGFTHNGNRYEYKT